MMTQFQFDRICITRVKPLLPMGQAQVRAYDSAVARVSFNRRRQSGEYVGNYSISREVRTFAYSSPCIFTVAFATSLTAHCMAYIACVVTYVWFMRVGI